MRTTSLKILLTIASVIGVVAIGAGGTFANFTATPTTIASNAFATGTLSMSRSGTGAVLSAQGLKIGDELTGSVTISNTGSLAGAYTLSGAAESGSNAALAGKLVLAVYKDVDGGTPLYSGSLSAFSSVGLGSFSPAGGTGASHTFYFHLSLPSTGTDAGDNALQGLSASESFTWSAAQA